LLNIQITDLTSLIAFWLCFTRLFTVMFQLPIFDGLPIPAMLKALTCLLITFTFFPHVSPHIIADINAVGEESFWVLTIYNAVIGLTIGYLVKAIMNIFVGCGAIITQQIGFGAISYFDPAASQQVGPFEKLISWTILIMILTSGALLPMFKGIFSSFATIHIGDLGKLSQAPLFFIGFFKSIFTSSLVLASPIIFINMLIMCILGIVARTVPQMNVLMVSFVVNIGMGLLVFAASSNEFFRVGHKLYADKLGEWFQLLI
jgi:flagellar biosynthetic protein FliR